MLRVLLGCSAGALLENSEFSGKADHNKFQVSASLKYTSITTNTTPLGKEKAFTYVRHKPPSFDVSKKRIPPPPIPPPKQAILSS